MTQPPADQHDERWHDDVAVYALGALDGPDLVAFEAHLGDCAVCRDDLAALRVAVEGLALSATPVQPPPELRDRIMRTVRSEAQLLAAAGPQADLPVRERRLRRLRFGGLVARPALSVAVTAALVVGVAIGALALTGGSTTSRLQTASVAAGAGPQASAQVRREGSRLALVVDRLATPQRGHIYELWIRRSSGAPRPSTLFALRSGSVTVPGDTRGVRTLMVTSEPAGGSPSPTTPPLIVANLS